MTKQKFAPLHGGLLARKGEAIPATIHPLGDQSFTTSSPSLRRIIETKRAPQPAPMPIPADLSTPDPPDPPPAGPAVQADPAQCASRCADAVAPALAPAPRRAQPFKASVRLSAPQRRLLRMVAAITNGSQQSILSQALDAYLESLAQAELRHCACYKKRLQGLGG